MFASGGRQRRQVRVQQREPQRRVQAQQQLEQLREPRLWSWPQSWCWPSSTVLPDGSPPLRERDNPLIGIFKDQQLIHIHPGEFQ